MKIGDRIKLISTTDPYTELKKGDKGTITDINKIQISVNWDNGSSLMMIPNIDKIKIINEKNFFSHTPGTKKKFL